MSLSTYISFFLLHLFIYFWVPQTGAVTPQCPENMNPYIPWQKTKDNPLTCIDDNNCPPAQKKYECKDAANDPSVKLCCHGGKRVPRPQPSDDNNKPGDGGKQGSHSQKKPDPSTELSVCPDQLPPGTGTCELGLSNKICDQGYVCTSTENRKPVCCPHFGTCMPTAKGDPRVPFMQSGLPLPLTCAKGSTSSCPTGYKCETSTTGDEICCPDFGTCRNGDEIPFTIQDQTSPLLCEIGSDSLCPKKYTCVYSSTRTPVCCPHYGKCAGGTQPRAQDNKNIPIKCTLNSAGCPESTVCATTTSGWTLCCPEQASAAANTQPGGQPNTGKDTCPRTAKAPHNFPDPNHKCDDSKGNCAADFRIWHCVKDQNGGKDMCCQDPGKCKFTNEDPLKDENGNIAICPIDPKADKTGFHGKCPIKGKESSHACLESTTGWPVCCEYFGSCKGGDEPFIDQRTKKPVACTIGTLDTCPKTPRKYVCEEGKNPQDGTTSFCCPLLGSCPSGMEPRLETNGDPTQCSDDANNPEPCPSGWACSTSTTNERICCRKKAFPTTNRNLQNNVDDFRRRSLLQFQHDDDNEARKKEAPAAKYLFGGQ